MSDQKKVYFNGVQIKQGQYGLKISVHVDKFIEQLQQYRNERGYVNMELKERQTVGQFGDTHSLLYDSWTPKSKAAPAAADDSEPLPF